MTTPAKPRVRYAVVGLGNIAQVAVLPAFEHAADTSELAALVSADPLKLAELGKRYDVSVTGGYDELERVLKQASVDAAYLAVPNSLHRELTERCARAGVHVLCEKPMALTEEDCQAMIDVTNSHGVKLMIAYRLHFEEANLRAIERVASGEIGEPRCFSSVFSHQVREGGIRTRKDLGGGALFDMGVYCVNAARYIFGDEPIEVYAEQVLGTDERSSEVDEMTAALLRFPGGRLAQLTASQGAADVSEFRIVGTKGDIRLDPAYEYRDKLREFVTIEGNTKTSSLSKRDQFAPELTHFSRCILEGREPQPSGWEGLADVRILQAMLRSARSGTKVALTPVAMPSRPDPSLAMKAPPTGHVATVHAPSPSK